MIVWLGFGALLTAIVEIKVIMVVAARIGLIDTVLLLILFSAAGAWIVKREGVSALHRLRDSTRDGRIPTQAVVDGVMILLAGALLLPPGFVTGVAGLLLIIPPVRRLVGAAAADMIRVRVAKRFTVTRTVWNGRRNQPGAAWSGASRGASGRSTSGQSVPDDVIDLDGEEIDLSDSSAELGPVSSD